jgi:hypothetical protein
MGLFKLDMLVYKEVDHSKETLLFLLLDFMSVILVVFLGELQEMIRHGNHQHLMI